MTSTVKSCRRLKKVSRGKCLLCIRLQLTIVDSRYPMRRLLPIAVFAISCFSQLFGEFRIYVTNHGSGTISVIDTDGDEVIFTIPTGGNPVFPIFTEDSSKAYVGNVGTSAIDIIDLSTHSVTSTVTVGSEPLRLLLVPIAPSPIDLQGKQIENRFLTQSDLINIISWEPDPNHSSAVSYKIYRNAALTDVAGTVAANGPLQFKDHNKQAKQPYTYYVVSEDALGSLSLAAVISLDPC